MTLNFMTWEDAFNYQLNSLTNEFDPLYMESFFPETDNEFIDGILGTRGYIDQVVWVGAVYNPETKTVKQFGVGENLKWYKIVFTYGGSKVGLAESVREYTYLNQLLAEDIDSEEILRNIEDLFVVFNFLQTGRIIQSDLTRQEFLANANRMFAFASNYNYTLANNDSEDSDWNCDCDWEDDDDYDYENDEDDYDYDYDEDDWDCDCCDSDDDWDDEDDYDYLEEDDFEDEEFWGCDDENCPCNWDDEEDDWDDEDDFDIEEEIEFGTNCCVGQTDIYDYIDEEEDETTEKETYIYRFEVSVDRNGEVFSEQAELTESQANAYYQELIVAGYKSVVVLQVKNLHLSF